MNGHTIDGVELFATGHYDGKHFDVPALHKIADAFNRLKSLGHEPPLRLGHDNKLIEQTDGAPSIGFLESVRVVGRKLIGKFTAVPSIIFNALKQRRYDKVSLTLYRNFEQTEAERNLRSGVTGPVIRDVALLGSALPRVRDLGSIASLLNAEHAAMAFDADDDDDLLTVVFTAPADETRSNFVDRRVEQMQTDNLALLSEQYGAEIVRAAARHGLDLNKPWDRQVARGAADESAAALALADHYRPYRATTERTAKLAEADDLERAVLVVCREKNLDATIYADRQCAMAELVNDGRFRHLLAAYDRSSIGTDGRARR